MAGKEVFFKCENVQRAGAFKIRGATNKILSLTADEKSLVSSHFRLGITRGSAVAAREGECARGRCHARRCAQGESRATREYVRNSFYDRQTQDREGVAFEIAARDSLVMVPPYDDYLIMAGQGTAGLELMEEVPDLDCVLTPCSGGGLFAGVATAVKGINRRVRCFAVEPETGDDTRRSFLKGECVTVPPPPTIADGLRVQSPGTMTFPILQQTAEDVLTVSDPEIVSAIKFMLFRMKLLVEPSGAAAAAAVMQRKLPLETRRVGVILSGGNIDPHALATLLNGTE